MSNDWKENRIPCADCGDIGKPGQAQPAQIGRPRGYICAPCAQKERASFSGYIPSGGVWTAEERESMNRGRTIPYGEDETERIVETVSVLIAALEDCLSREDGVHPDAYTDDGFQAERIRARALLDSLK